MRWTNFIPGVLLALLAASATAEVVWPALIAPTRIDSDDLERIVKDTDFTREQRTVVESAFDEQIERWQHLRDEVIRPFDRQVSDLKLEFDRRMWLLENGRRESAHPDTEVAAADAPEGTGPSRDELERSIERRAHALEQTRRRIFHRIKAAEQEFIAALQAIAEGQAQRESIDLFVQRRRMAWSNAMLRSTRQMDLTGLDDLPELPVTLRDAEMRARASARLLRLGHDHADLAHQAAEPALAGDSNRSAQLINALMRLRLSAIDEIASMMPPDLAERWSRLERDRLLIRHEPGHGSMLSRAGLSAVLGDRIPPAVVDRIERWRVDRRLFEDRMLLPKPGDTVPDDPGSREKLDGIDTQALADIAELSGVQDLGVKLKAWRMSQPQTEWSGDEITPEPDLFGTFESLRMIFVAEIEPMLMEFGEHLGNSSNWPMHLARLRQLHDELGVPETKQALWNMLVEDFRDRTVELLKSMPKRELGIIRHDIETSVKLREKVGRMEEDFFDALAAALPDLPAGAVPLQRARRAHQRLTESVRGANLDRGFMSGSLLIVDPFKVTDDLSPEACAAITEPLTRWMERRGSALRALRELDETHRRFEAGVRDDHEPPRAYFETVVRLRAQWARLILRSEEDAKRELQEILAGMPVDDARQFKWSIRRLQEPDVCQPRYEFEGLLDRACSIDGSSPEQRDRLQALRTDHRDRAELLEDEIAANIRSIRRLDTQDCIEQDEHANTPPEQRVDTEIDQRQRQQLHSERVSELTWDLQELNARARRRLAAVVDFTTLEARDKP